MITSSASPRESAATSHEAAASVADAVKRVADAAVAEIQKRPTGFDPGDFIFSHSGNTFTIRGYNNLGPSGTVLFGGQQLQTTEWGTSFIAGIFPSNPPAADGKNPVEVKVVVDPHTIRRGFYRP